MYEELESESEFDSESEPSKIVTPPKNSLDPEISTPGDLFVVMLHDFNKINKTFEYVPLKNPSNNAECLATNEHEKEPEEEYTELIKAVNEQELKTPIIEDTESVNIGTEENPKIIKIGLTLTPTEKADLISTLREF